MCSNTYYFFIKTEKFSRQTAGRVKKEYLRIGNPAKIDYLYIMENINTLFSLDGKVTLVTGAAYGIGPGYIATPQTAPLREPQPDKIVDEAYWSTLLALLGDRATREKTMISIPKEIIW